MSPVMTTALASCRRSASQKASSPLDERKLRWTSVAQARRRGGGGRSETTIGESTPSARSCCPWLRVTREARLDRLRPERVVLQEARHQRVDLVAPLGHDPPRTI